MQLLDINMNICLDGINSLHLEQEQNDVPNGRCGSKDCVWAEYADDGEHGTVGRIVSVTERGFVMVTFEPETPESEDNVIEFELEELQFYAGTKFLSNFLKLWSWKENYVMKLGKSCETTFRSPTLHPRVLKIYQVLPHGKVYLNRQIQLKIHQQITLYYRNYLNEPKESVFVKASENGDLLFQSFLPLRDRIVNYLRLKSLPAPETRDSLMLKTETQLMNSVYVTRSNVEKYLQRIKISKLIYGKSEIIVNFIDIGNEAKIKIVNVYDANKIDINYAQFPPLLYRCHLNGIVHVDVGACREKLKHQFAYVQLAEPLEDPDDATVIPEVYVYLRSKEGRLLLNKALIKDGFAVPEITKDQVSSFRESELALSNSKAKPVIENPTRLNGIRVSADHNNILRC